MYKILQLIRIKVPYIGLFYPNQQSFRRALYRELLCIKLGIELYIEPPTKI